MWRRQYRRALVSCLLAGALASCSRSESKVAEPWKPEAAAAYLDQRMDWWLGWQRAARDHGTVCVSCHTAMPYALSRPRLRGALDRQTPSVDERRLLENVTKRVRLWKEIGPYYSDASNGPHKTVESRGTEAVINALVLTNRDAEVGHLSDDARAALDNMWAAQEPAGDARGAWSWLQFGLEPWEGRQSQYYGAALAAIAAGTAPDDYLASPDLTDHRTQLRAYLNREYATQSLLNRVVLLWASTKYPDLLTPDARGALIKEVFASQQGDGGWSVAALASTSKGSTLRTSLRKLIGAIRSTSDGAGESDGYATGLVAFTLLQAGTPRDNARVQQALSWLVRHQNRAEGSWAASSLNRHRDPSSDIGRFMSDAATAYAVLALSQANCH